MNKLRITLGGIFAIAVVTLILTLSSAPTTIAIEDTINFEIEPSEKDLESTIRDESLYSPMGDLSLIEIFEQSEPGIVSITITASSIIGPSGVGSGFVYDNKGNIITNNHVVDNAEKIVVTFIDGRSYNAEIVGTDAYSDLAVIKIDVEESQLKPLEIGNSDLIKVGQKVTAIGNPYGLSGSMTAGIVSQIGRLLPSQDSGFSIPDVIQTDAAINPGNSGGPLLNLKGEVIGVTTAIYSQDGTFSGVGFAVPSNTINKIIPVLIDKGSYKHPWIGISSIDITPDLADILGLENARGVMIMEVVSESPASKVGLRGSSEIIEKQGIEYKIGGDVILAIDEKDVRKIDDIITHLQKEKEVGDNTNFKILRDDKIITIEIELEERP